MDLERKGVQSYQSLLYVRFLCFGNGALTALHDQSDGFFRRQIVLTTRDRPADRVDDPFLAEKLAAEREGIFLWCLEGLHRLIAQNYRFTISPKAQENVETVRRGSNNVVEFLQSEGYIRFRADYEASSKSIYKAYKVWCEDNVRKPCQLTGSARADPECGGLQRGAHQQYLLRRQAGAGFRDRGGRTALWLKLK